MYACMHIKWLIKELCLPKFPGCDCHALSLYSGLIFSKAEMVEYMYDSYIDTKEKQGGGPTVSFFWGEAH